MHCYVCDGEMEKTQKEIETTWEGITATFRGLEVWQCNKCGEECYEAGNVRMMQAIISIIPRDKNNPRIINVGDVADLSKLSHETISKLFRAGKLYSTNIGNQSYFHWRDISGENIDRDRGGAVGLAARSNKGCTLSDNDEEIIRRHIEQMGRSET